jgi:hypothetical protein
VSLRSMRRSCLTNRRREEMTSGEEEWCSSRCVWVRVRVCVCGGGEGGGVPFHQTICRLITCSHVNQPFRCHRAASESTTIRSGLCCTGTLLTPTACPLSFGGASTRTPETAPKLPSLGVLWVATALCGVLVGAVGPSALLLKPLTVPLTVGHPTVWPPRARCRTLTVLRRWTTEL